MGLSELEFGGVKHAERRENDAGKLAHGNTNICEPGYLPSQNPLRRAPSEIATHDHAVSFFFRTRTHLQGSEGHVVHGAPGANVCAHLPGRELCGEHLGVDPQQRRRKVHIRLVRGDRTAAVRLVKRDVALNYNKEKVICQFEGRRRVVLCVRLQHEVIRLVRSDRSAAVRLVKRDVALNTTKEKGMCQFEIAPVWCPLCVLPT